MVEIAPPKLEKHLTRDKIIEQELSYATMSILED